MNSSAASRVVKIPSACPLGGWSSGPRHEEYSPVVELLEPGSVRGAVLLGEWQEVLAGEVRHDEPHEPSP
jgi:hypothetical protein